MTPWAKLAGAVVVVGGLSWGVHALVQHGDAAGYARANLEWEEKEQAVEAQVAAKYDEALVSTRQRAADLQKELDALELARYQENTNAAKNLEKAVAAAVARTERLSIRTSATGCAVPGGATSGNSGPASGAGGEARTDLLPETAAAIFSIAADSAGLVRDYNDVVRRYDLARIACNAK